MLCSYPTTGWAGAVPGQAGRARDIVGCIAALPLATRIGQVLLGLSPDVAGAVADVRSGRLGAWAPIGPVDLTPLAALVVDDGHAPFIPPLLAADEEGGIVQRLSPPLPRLPAAAELAATRSEVEVRALFAEHGRQLRALGVTMALAPVADVGGGPGISSRSFSSDPATVSRYAQAVADGYRDAGVVPVFKHFPGHGRASDDTHTALAVTPPIDELRTFDLVPFLDAVHRGGDGVGIMVGHLAVPGLTGDQAASMSPAAISGLLRGELGFGGLVVSDSFDMGAIRTSVGPGGPGDAVRRFLLAGGDLAIIHVADTAAVHAAVTEALTTGQLPVSRLDEAVGRVLRTKGVDPCSLAQPAPREPGTIAPATAPTTSATAVPGGAGGPDASTEATAIAAGRGSAPRPTTGQDAVSPRRPYRTAWSTWGPTGASLAVGVALVAVAQWLRRRDRA